MSNLATIVNNILADSGIDDINVVVTTGSYSNPAWITALAWTKITGTPTTLAGYGITNAYTKTETDTLLSAKQNTLTLTTTGTSGAATLVGATLNIPQYQSVLTNPVTGTGVTNRLTYWSGTSTIGYLDTASYPSLTELSYVKGVTSSIQNQLDGKLSTNSDSEQEVPGRYFRFNAGSGIIRMDPRWNESGYDADLGVLHIYSTTAGGANYGRTGIALYNDSAYVYLTTVSGNSNLFVNNNIVLNAGNYNSYALPLSGGTLTGPVSLNNNSYFVGSPNYGFRFNNAADTANNMTLTNANGDLYVRGQVYVGGNGSNTGTQLVYNSGTWSINTTGFALLLDDVDNYTWSSSTLPTSYSLGMQLSFVGPNAGEGSWQNYGTIINARTYAGGGGSLQIYVPYGPNNGGPALQVRFGDYSAPTYGNQWTAWKTLLQSDNYNSYAPTLTGTGASGTWGINVTGSAGSTGTLLLTGLGNGSVNVNNPNSAVYRTETGNGAALAYAPVLHLGGGDTMWQVQGTYGTSGDGTLYFRQGYNGSWGTWLTMLSSANYNSYAPTLTGGGASGTWGISITGNAATASTANSVAWSNISGGYRTNYDLGFRPADNSSSFAGFRFATVGNDGDAGYLLIRGGEDSGVYTQDGITLVADKGWLTLAQRTTANKGVRIMTGTSSTLRISVTDSFTDLYNIVSSRTGSNTVDNVRFYNQDGNYAYIRTTSAGNNNNPWYDGTLGSTMWYAWDNPGQARTADVYTEHRFGNGRGSLSEYVKINRGRLYTHNSSDVATITLNGLTGIQSFSSSNGTIISNASVTDMIGYNSTYQTYISGTATTLYATGIYYDGSGYRTLLHSANYNTYAVARYQTTQTGDNPVKIWNGHLASYSTNGGGNTYTIIQTSVPQDNYQMGGFTIEFFNNYESTNGKTQIDLGGYWNPEVNGGFIGFEYHTSNPFVTPNIQVARNSSTGNVAFIITNSGQSYQVVEARDLWLGYNASADSAWGTGWTIYGTNSISGFTNNDGVVARVAATSTGSNASGTWGINITGSAGSVGWANISGGVRTNYDLGIQAPSGGGYAGFYWRGADGVDAGYFLIRSATGDVYTENGITLVGDRNWVTIASRTTTDKGVRLMAGQTSVSRLVAHSSGQVVIGSSAETKFSTDSVALYVKGGSAGWSVFERNNKRLYINGNYSDLNTFCQVSSEASSNMGLSLSAREVKEDIYLTQGGLIGIGTDDFSYTANDNTPLVGSTTNNKLFVSGSIQLNGNNDAIVFGRGTASFFKDEEIGFGWGGGWYMLDATYLRVRNNKTIYTTGDYEGRNLFLKTNGYLELYVQDNTSFCHADARPNGSYAALHKYTYRPSTGNYGQYREYWWDGDSYHSIYVSGDQFYFDSSVNAPSFFETSDARFKTLIEDNHIPVGIESIVAKLYEKDGKTEIGYFAQDVEKIMSHAISKSEEGFLNLSYREVHTAKIAYLEQKVIYLENQLKQIKNENN